MRPWGGGQGLLMLPTQPAHTLLLQLLRRERVHVHISMTQLVPLLLLLQFLALYPLLLLFLLPLLLLSTLPACLLCSTCSPV